MKVSPFDPPLLGEKDNLLRWSDLHDDSMGLAISRFVQQSKSLTLLITPDAASCVQLQQQLSFFLDKSCPILHFPDWEILPYDHFSPHEDIVSTRLATIHRIQRQTQGVVISALPTLMRKLYPTTYISAHSFVLNRGESLDPTELRQQLTHCGYHLVEQVLEHGEFAIRGHIVDLFPMGSTEPFRIELFDNEIESIRYFSPETQKSTHKVEQINLLPAREYALAPENITHFRQEWRARFSGNPAESQVYTQISQGEPIAGIENYLPLFFEDTAHFFSFLPSATQLITVGDVYQASSDFWREVNNRYENLRYDITRPLCAPLELFLNVEETFAQIKQYPRVQIDEIDSEKKSNKIIFETRKLSSLLINNKLKKPLKLLAEFINDYSGRVLFCTESSGRRETLIELLASIGVMPKTYDTWQSFCEDDREFGITIAALEQGFSLPDPDITLITESQLFGEQVKQRRLRAQRQQDPNLMIRNLTELNIGSPVVHIDHGIGRYLGLQVLETGGITAEYLTLEYAAGDKIYVPVASLHLISRYSGVDEKHAPINRLGSKQWEKEKEKAAKRIRDVAAELLNIYSQRASKLGFAFPQPGNDYELFRADFPFEETPDQTRAIADIIQDMTSAKCMDRLVCGDVGFGKTEVAMQAAFLAANSGKQVAILVPTTLLAAQHYESFSNRFADWPIQIAGLSRLRTPKETAETISGLASGRIDIVVGTHKLLSEKIKFKDLGFLIIDEEHRFGVRQKERIKALRANIDILTLTATPIPRTLNLALTGTRDLSIISTPPARRLAVKTFIHEHSVGIIREAISRETMRGGQTYFLHNDVATIDAMREKLLDIVPAAKIAIAHGQMPERQLERVMSDFYHQRFNVLLCSTIIESGIDVPTANTMIINRADRFGLAQLHQLRGRVGRSHHQAYAYLITPHKKTLTADAKRRLEAFSTMEDLGAGFYLANHDLEIRGAGEILGEEQSGHIHAIGFSLYMELLEDAVSALKSGNEPVFTKELSAGPEIDLKISALLPETYVRDVHTRLTLYKRLSGCNNEDEILEFKSELIDRFGLLPEPAQHLLRLAGLKQLAQSLGIKKIDVGTQYGRMQFVEKPAVDPANIIKLIQLEPKRYQLQGADTLRFLLDSKEDKVRLDQVEKLLKKL